MAQRPTIADLLAQDRLQQIEPDAEEARELLAHAEKHLASAETLLAKDPAGAYQLLYDAARKAAAADMLAAGYRAKSDKPGAHAAVVSYAEEALAGHADAEAIANFDRIRRSRNRSEYGAIAVGNAQLHVDLEHAREIVRAAKERVMPVQTSENEAPQ
jgi:uncharacterized protein (UPF0332 family)